MTTISVNDKRVERLESMGYRGSFNGMAFSHLGDLGFTGALPDRVRGFGPQGEYIDNITSRRNQLTLNGSTQCVEFAHLAGIDLDSLDVTLEGYFDLSGAGTLWSQNISATASAKELQVFKNSAGSVDLAVVIGGDTNLVSLGGDTTPGVWKLILRDGKATLSKDGVVTEFEKAITIGVAREPTAPFRVGCRGNGAGARGFFLGGVVKDIVIRAKGACLLRAPLGEGFMYNPSAYELAFDTVGTYFNLTSGAWAEVDL